MTAAALSRPLTSDRAVPASLAIGAVCGCALLALVDPGRGGVYPACPTRTLLGVDCPACGTLRGVHALARGQIGTALNHNLLLLLAVPIGAVLWWGWVRAAVGRPARPMALPRWAAPLLIGIAVVFAVVRNLPIDSVAWLDSAA